MKKIIVLLLLSLSLLAQAEVRDPDHYFFDSSFGDLQEELSLAREQGKKGLLLMFEMEGCPFCYKMRTTVLNQSEVQDFYKSHFLILSIDILGDVELVDFNGQETTMKAFARRMQVKATPTFQFFDLHGQPTARFVGVTSPKGFMLLAQYVLDGAYQTMSFKQYLQSKL